MRPSKAIHLVVLTILSLYAVFDIIEMLPWNEVGKGTFITVAALYCIVAACAVAWD